MKYSLIEIEGKQYLISGDDFHNKNLKSGNLAYHRKLKQIGKVIQYKEDVAQWSWEYNGVITNRDSYLLFKVYKLEELT